MITKLIVLLHAASGLALSSMPIKLDCDGSGYSEGYPFGRASSRPVSYSVEVSRGSVTVTEIGPNLAYDGRFCPKGASCKSTLTASTAELSVQDIPYRLIYFQQFALSLNRRTFQATGGGIDGGWFQQGKCHATR
jgi:hypothetical protein